MPIDPFNEDSYGAKAEFIAEVLNRWCSGVETGGLG
jgi:hypothetical protein